LQTTLIWRSARRAKLRKNFGKASIDHAALGDLLKTALEHSRVSPIMAFTPLPDRNIGQFLRGLLARMA
jgi:hypothetical protein